MFADTDFFLALLKESDWLKEKALKIYKQHKSEIWTSEPVAIELLLLSKEFDMDAEELISSLSRLCQLRADVQKLLLAAHYIKEKNFHVFDALHAAYCDNAQIISSDHIYDTIGMNRIRLEE